MGADFTTETIAHFIGVFNQTIESARMRIEYDAFKAEKAKAEDGAPTLTVTVTIQGDIEHEDIRPEIKVDPIRPDSLPRFDEPLWWAPAVDAGPVTGTWGLDLPADPGLFRPLPVTIENDGSDTIQSLLPPSSVATVIVQKVHLTDHDILMMEDSALQPVAVDHYDANLDGLIGLANYLSGPSATTVPETGATISDTAFQMAAQASAFTPAPHDAATIHILTGDDAGGIMVNGEIAEEMPDWQAALPDSLSPKQTDAEPEDDGPAHEIVTGSNALVNQVFLSKSWIDAPVIAVMGDSHSMASISQTNVLQNIDMVNGHRVAAHGAQSDTMLNAAALLTNDAPLPEVDEDREGQFPDDWTVTRLDGDLVNMNWLDQMNYVTDHDVTSLTLTGQETWLQTGGNVANNLAGILELGFGFDLIVVGGDIIDVSMIQQTNVLLDDDSIFYPDDDAWSISTDGNSLWNHAAIRSSGVNTTDEMPDLYKKLAGSLETGSDAVGAGVRGDDPFEGMDRLDVLYIEGDLISLQAIRQINYAGDADQVEMKATQAAMTEGGEVSVSTGANFLINIAELSDFGVDSDVYVQGEQYSDALMHQAGLIVSDPGTQGLGGDGLASEAVAFLADGMIGEEKDDTFVAPDTGGGVDASHDVMGGILT